MNFNFKNKGSALVAIIIIVTFCSIIIGSLLKWGATEHKINEHHFIRLKAQNAAESLLSSGVAQLISRWMTVVSFPNNDLKEYPLEVTDEIKTFYDFTGSLIDPESFELMGGSVSDAQWAYIDPDDPANSFDPQKGKNVLVRYVEMISKASGSITTFSQPITVYAMQRLQVRDAPLFAYAIFYNMDLEFHPGPKMDIYGPVHSNGNIYGSAVDKLYFHDSVTTSGNYYHGLMPGHPESPQTGSVYFKNIVNDFLSDYKGSGDKTSESSYYDSNYINWRELASNRWSGNLETQEHEVPHLNPVGYKNYVRDNPDTPEVDDDLNYAYALIEPNLPASHYAFKGEGEKEKYAQKAGLIVRVYNYNPGGSPSEVFQVKGGSNYYVTFHRLERQNSSNPFSKPVLNADGDVAVERTIDVKKAFVDKVFSMQEYDENDDGEPQSGFWDARRKEGISTLTFNINEFRKGVDDSSVYYDDKVWTGSGSTAYIPENHYNGVVYVEFPIDYSKGLGPDNILVSQDNLGLLVTDAKEVPNPKYNQNSSVRDPGFTLATNNTIYLSSHFNADGKENTGSPTDPDSSTNPDPPSSIIADSITILSENWDPKNSKKSKNYRKAAFTEVSAALVQGIYPTNKKGSGIGSGGNHNFPRFLESWSGKAFRYRGSMVALYESEIADKGYSTSYYDPPKREWGFYSEFAKGHYPPGTPFLRSFRTIDFSYIKEADYNNYLNTIVNNFDDDDL